MNAEVVGQTMSMREQDYPRLERQVQKLEARVTRLEHLGDLLAEDVVDYAGKRDLLNRLPNVKRWQKARK